MEYALKEEKGRREMADQITNYKCPACGGPLHFAATSGRMECEYCNSDYSVEEIEQRYAEDDAKAAAAKAEADAKAADSAAAGQDEWTVTGENMSSEGMKSYSCPSCGATLVCEDTMAASSCPYCGNPTVVPGQFTDMLKPEIIIPFKLEKEAAIDTLKKHYNKFLVPSAFKDVRHLDEVKGVYVPFWLYDGHADGDCTYEAVKEKTEKKGDEEIITKRYYHVERRGSLEFEKIPADASSKMDDNLMDSIEPYNYSEGKAFSKAYLTGYLADRYDVSAEENAGRAVARAKQSTKDALYNDVQGYTSVSPRRENINVKQGKVYYAMMPVWLLTTRWNGQNYTFAMNGQTGKMVGDLPLNKSKFWITLIAILAVAFGLGFAVSSDAVVGGIVGLVAFLIAFLILKSSVKSVYKATTANNYIDDSATKITHRVDNFVREDVQRRKLNS